MKNAFLSLAAALLTSSALAGFPFAAANRAQVTQGPNLLHVANQTERLSLTAAIVGHPIIAGFQIIQDDNLEASPFTFLGAGIDANAGLLVEGAGSSEWNGAYVLNETGGYNQQGDGGVVVHTPGELGLGEVWGIKAGADVVYRTSNNPAFPWDAAWDVNISGNYPIPTVSRNPVASNANWAERPKP
jgi:hypothetical protein